MDCLICHNTFENRADLRFTCRCRGRECICIDCGEGMSYQEGASKFHAGSYVDDRVTKLSPLALYMLQERQDREKAENFLRDKGFLLEDGSIKIKEGFTDTIRELYNTKYIEKVRRLIEAGDESAHVFRGCIEYIDHTEHPNSGVVFSYQAYPFYVEHKQDFMEIPRNCDLITKVTVFADTDATLELRTSNGPMVTFSVQAGETAIELNLVLCALQFVSCVKLVTTAGHVTKVRAEQVNLGAVFRRILVDTCIYDNLFNLQYGGGLITNRYLPSPHLYFNNNGILENIEESNQVRLGHLIRCQEDFPTHAANIDPTDWYQE